MAMDVQFVQWEHSVILTMLILALPAQQGRLPPKKEVLRLHSAMLVRNLFLKHKFSSHFILYFLEEILLEIIYLFFFCF